MSCPYNAFKNTTSNTCVQCNFTQYASLTAQTCIDYNNLYEKVAHDRSLSISDDMSFGNTAFIIVSAMLVMLMLPGLALYYGSLSNENNVINTVLLSLTSMALISVVWLLLGYSVAFGPGGEFIGTGEWGAFTSVGAGMSAVYGDKIPHVVFALFQCMFAQITPAILSGAVAGRIKFVSYSIFIVAWILLVYCPIARWVWALKLNETTGEIEAAGFLGKLGVIDGAGGNVIHISGGISAAAAALVIGPRLVRVDVKVDIAKALTGWSLLYFGWFGFNAGSALSANAVAGGAAVATHFSACSCIVTWMICEYIHERRISFTGMCSAGIIGLVVITPCCLFVSSQSSLAIGAIGAIVCYLFHQLKTNTRLDEWFDDADVLRDHGVAGFLGVFLTGVFADEDINGGSLIAGGMNAAGKQIGYQLAAAVICSLWSFFVTAILCLILKYTIGIRVDEDDELFGLDRKHENDADANRDLTYAHTDDDEQCVIVFTDIESSSRLWSKSHSLMAKALDKHNKSVRRLLEKYNGYEVKIIGDSFFAIFRKEFSANAIRFAADLQLELHSNVEWDDEGKLNGYYKKWNEAKEQRRKLSLPATNQTINTTETDRSTATATPSTEGDSASQQQHHNLHHQHVQLINVPIEEVSSGSPASYSNNATLTNVLLTPTSGSGGAVIPTTTSEQQQQQQEQQQIMNNNNNNNNNNTKHNNNPTTVDVENEESLPSPPSGITRTETLRPETTSSVVTMKMSSSGNEGGGGVTAALATSTSHPNTARTSNNNSFTTSNQFSANGLRVRVGLHYGFAAVQFNPIANRYDYLGTSINAAARIEALGHGGQTLCSREAWEAAVRADPALANEYIRMNLGSHALRGVRGTTTIFQVANPALASRRFPPLRVEIGGDDGAADGGGEAMGMVTLSNSNRSQERQQFSYRGTRASVVSSINESAAGLLSGSPTNHSIHQHQHHHQRNDGHEAEKSSEKIVYPPNLVDNVFGTSTNHQQDNSKQQQEQQPRAVGNTRKSLAEINEEQIEQERRRQQGRFTGGSSSVSGGGGGSRRSAHSSQSSGKQLQQHFSSSRPDSAAAGFPDHYVHNNENTNDLHVQSIDGSSVMNNVSNSSARKEKLLQQEGTLCPNNNNTTSSANASREHSYHA